MRTPCRTAIAVLMLITFVMGVAFHGLNPTWIAHELDHDRAALAASYDHEPMQKADSQHDEDEPFDVAEHKLLHALSHCAQVPCTPSIAFAKAAEGNFFLPIVLFLVAAERQPLFRPPRSISLL